MNTFTSFLLTDASEGVSSSDISYFPDYSGARFASMVSSYDSVNEFGFDFGPSYGTFDYIIDSNCPSCQLANINFSAFNQNTFGNFSNTTYYSPVARF